MNKYLNPKLIYRSKPSGLVAFTLAEVILVIGIIGIVAALTLSQLFQTADNKDLVSAFLKSHNTLANAYKEAIVLDSIQKMNVADFKKTFEEHLKTIPCDDFDVCLYDGMAFDYVCDEDEQNGKCTYLNVDTNNMKRPNVKGKDKYKFLITPTDIIPTGDTEQCFGDDCGNYVLTYHKIFEGIGYCVNYIKSGVCNRCADGYELVSNECKKLNLPNCIDYKGEKCSKCTDETILYGEACKIKTDLHCSEKSSDSETCKTCENQYKNVSGLCEKVTIPNCLAYSGDKCSSCNNISKLSNGTCVNKFPGNYVPQLGWYVWTAGSANVSSGGSCSPGRLPSVDELKRVCGYRGSYGIPNNGYYWTTYTFALNDYFGRTTVNMYDCDTRMFAGNHYDNVLCIGVP